MRLIDADALIEKMVQIPLRQWNTKTFGEALDSIPTVGGWVNVKDRLPDTLDCYLVLLKNHGGIELDVFSNTLGVFKHNRQYVEYWMKIPPLPEPPEEVSGDG
jgi:hypothetical protein